MQFHPTPLILSVAAFTALALPATSVLAEPGHTGHAHAAEQEAEYVGDPYPLAIDPVTGEKLGDDAVTHVHEGRQLRFNSEKNVETFMKDTAKYLADVDAKLIEMQREFYPLATCPVSGGELGSMGEPKEMIVGNRLVKLCCAGCVGKVREDPEAIIAKLDAAVIEKQAGDVKTTVCPVSGDEYGGAMGEPVNYVIANRLVKLCCAGCVGMLEENPAKYLAMLDGEKPASEKSDDHARHDH